MPINHYVQNQGKLVMQSRENGQKPQFGQFFDHFEFKYLHTIPFHKLWTVKVKCSLADNFLYQLDLSFYKQTLYYIILKDQGTHN